MKKKIAITLGDPGSIGPETVLKSFESASFDPSDFVLIGNKSSLMKCGLSIPQNLEILEVMPEISDFEFGVISKTAGEIAFKSLQKACELASASKIRAIVTAPVSKEAINLAGHRFSGQTEILEHFLSKNNEKAEMLFASKDFRVLLLSRHVPLFSVPSLITKELVEKKIEMLSKQLQDIFKIAKPKIALCALNPHAGEGGLIGHEETEILIPSVKNLRQKGVDVHGPFAADMLFAKAAKAYAKTRQPYDCYVACYHDQGLCAVKTIDISDTVNTTIGLSIIRTSPAHGTAFDIAGMGIADCTSMKSAIKLAFELSF